MGHGILYHLLSSIFEISRFSCVIVILFVISGVSILPSCLQEVDAVEDVAYH